MQILKNRQTQHDQLIQLTFERRGVYRVQIWTQDNMDWDWIEGDYKDMKEVYELCEHIDDLAKI